jgi:hypothetical protein
VAFQSAEDPLTTTTKGWVAFPAHVIAKNVNGIEPGPATKVSERRETFHGMLTEQLAPRPLDLGRPDQGSEY